MIEYFVDNNLYNYGQEGNRFKKYYSYRLEIIYKILFILIDISPSFTYIKLEKSGCI